MTNSENGSRENYSERTNIMLFAPKEKGQGLVEYAIILALIAIGVLVLLKH